MDLKREFIAWTKNPPKNIIKVVDKFEQIIGDEFSEDLGWRIICDWSYVNDCTNLFNTRFLNIVDKHYIKNQTKIHNLHIIITTMNNIVVDVGCEIQNMELVLNRVEVCMDSSYMTSLVSEFVELIMLYSERQFNETVLEFFIKHFDNNALGSLRKKSLIVKNFCTLDATTTWKVFEKYNFTSTIVSICESGYSHHLIRLLSYLVERDVNLKLTENILQNIWKCNDEIFITFVTLYIKVKPEFKKCNTFKLFVNSIPGYRCFIDCKLEFLLEVFQTDDYNKYLNNTIFDYVCYYKNTTYVSKRLLYKLLRKFYDYKPGLFNTRLYNKILRDGESRYFCTTLLENAYSTCLKNNIKVDKFFTIKAI